MHVHIQFIYTNIAPFRLWVINTLARELFCIHTFWNQKFFRWKPSISSFAGTGSWDHESILPPFWLYFDSKWKVASPLIALFSFSHYFTTWIIYFLCCVGLNVLVTNLENMVAKQSHHSFASHSLHFLHDILWCGLPWRTWTSFSPEKKAYYQLLMEPVWESGSPPVLPQGRIKGLLCPCCSSRAGITFPALGGHVPHVRNAGSRSLICFPFWYLMISQWIQMLHKTSKQRNDPDQRDTIREHFPSACFMRMGKEADVFHQQLMLKSYYYSLPNHKLCAIIIYSLLLLL